MDTVTDLVPCLRHKVDRSLRPGRAGKDHCDIYTTEELVNRVNDWEHGFFHPDHGFLTRDESRVLFNV